MTQKLQAKQERKHRKNLHVDTSQPSPYVKRLPSMGSGGRPMPSPPPGLPRWEGYRPQVGTNASAGLAPVPGARHTTVYNATLRGGKNPFGVYNHGPMITRYGGVYYMSWYNAPVDEVHNKRSVYASSLDGVTWSRPAVLFPMFTQQPDPLRGEENGPWTILGVEDPAAPHGRLYTQSGTQDAGEHHEGIVSVARRVALDGNSSALGPPFWLNRTLPSYCTDKKAAECNYPTYLEMDATTRADAEQLLASLVRTTVALPDHVAQAEVVGAMKYNERSLYMRPGSRELVLLLRGHHGALSASLCTLPPVPTVVEHTLFSCRAGVGDAFMNLVEIVRDFGNASNPRVCNWTDPVPTSIPDAGSRTCAASFPQGSGGLSGVYMVGNQLDKGRDPVTLSLSRDGEVFDRHWAVRYGVSGNDIDHGGSCPRYPGAAKCCGYQYPGAMVDVQAAEMIVSYSIGKEDIALTRFPLSALAP